MYNKLTAHLKTILYDYIIGERKHEVNEGGAKPKSSVIPGKSSVGIMC